MLKIPDGLIQGPGAYLGGGGRRGWADESETHVPSRLKGTAARSSLLGSFLTKRQA